MIQWASLMVNGKESACQRSRQVQSLGWEDALEKEMAIPSSSLAWKTSGTREAWRAPLDTESQTGLNNGKQIHCNIFFYSSKTLETTQ